jgi:hypothetical protein
MGAMAGALVGAGMSGGADNAGIRIIRENNLADPAQLITTQLGEDLRRELGLLPTNQAIYVQDDDLAPISAADPPADVVLDVWVNSLRLDRLGKTKGYGLSFGAYVRLIDAKVVHSIDGKKGAVIAHGSCSRAATETPDAPSYEAFMAKGARRLKQELDLAARHCVEALRANVLGIATPPGAVVEARTASRPQSASSISTETGK